MGSAKVPVEREIPGFSAQVTDLCSTIPRVMWGSGRALRPWGRGSYWEKGARMSATAGQAASSGRQRFKGTSVQHSPLKSNHPTLRGTHYSKISPEPPPSQDPLLLRATEHSLVERLPEPATTAWGGGVSRTCTSGQGLVATGPSSQLSAYTKTQPF